MKITFTNSGNETEIIINDDAKFKQFIKELKSIIDGSDQYTHVHYIESNFIDYTFPSEFIRNSIVKMVVSH